MDEEETTGKPRRKFVKTAVGSVIGIGVIQGRARGERTQALTTETEPRKTAATATRTLSRATAGPDEEVTVTLNATADGANAIFLESFSPSVESSTVETVSANGSSVEPSFDVTGSGGVMVTVENLSAGDDITVRYSVVIAEDSGEDGEVTIEGGYTSGNIDNQSIPADTIEISNGSFSGIVADYNADGDDDIDISELNDAAQDYINEEITIAQLNRVAQEYINTS